MKSGWVEFVATLERRFGLKILHVPPNARDRSNFFALAENDGGIFRLQISGYFRLIFAAPMADVVDMEIEMVAPEKWWHCEWLARPEDVTRRGLTLPLPHDPVLNPNAARARVRPVCDVTGRKDPGDARFQKFIDHNAIVRGDARVLGKPDVRSHSDSNHNQVAIQSRSVVELPPYDLEWPMVSARNGISRRARCEFRESGCRVRARELSRAAADLSRSRPPRFALTQRGSDLQPDEA